ncbi:hypothetical protein [Corallococcus sp. CA054B]|uniref:hypothetical protein n=1 Tax=Corallococcus sp. CA054B TaxID=2316734 RepID=UPI0011C446FF|nr:hypothetical protein [Corallococcus sp. CA054B]
MAPVGKTDPEWNTLELRAPVDEVLRALDAIRRAWAEARWKRRKVTFAVLGGMALCAVAGPSSPMARRPSRLDSWRSGWRWSCCSTDCPCPSCSMRSGSPGSLRTADGARAPADHAPRRVVHGQQMLLSLYQLLHVARQPPPPPKVVPKPKRDRKAKRSPKRRRGGV